MSALAIIERQMTEPTAGQLVPLNELMVREGKKITLEGAMNDFYWFCEKYEIDATIHDNAWTSERLGMQRISAYDIYNIMDQIMNGLLDARQKQLQQQQKLIGQA